MIAIAGAKGGCGKTTTTLGLAEAFGRAGTPALAVDADRQLPNLHVRGGIDREPTLVAARGEDDVLQAAQTDPRSSNVALLPAPKSSEQLDMETAIERLSPDSVQSLIDCPSGAGPDVVDPLSVADAVVVVTTADDRSLDAAETTVEMANRLGVPVLGAIINQSTDIPETVRSWVDVPVLGVVPEVDDPLSSDDSRAVYDEIVRTLQTKNATVRTPPAYADELLGTGIDTLDRRLGGGFPPGTVVALTADPASQSEQLLYQTTAVRGSLYITTRRSERNVDRAIESSTLETGSPTVRRIDGEGAEPFDRFREILDKLPDGANLLVDTASALERRDRRAYVAFLNDLKDRMAETNGVAVLHCPTRTVPENREITTHFADVVLELETVSSGVGADVEHYLSVPKHRADCGFSETIELRFDGTSNAITVPADGELGAGSAPGVTAERRSDE
ncbi:ATPase involved in chromosome partitioning-like protein [Haloterrigena turkmenica DSM 5511]|uniref:ATPase involved in chromosome partitioning-like protein n=1 Tax=Haloterrigena turkmenica (strain ATCC 51198 / DSM 5511 / JCM 9101 / NCIMB 13204 / VKM B-1734 / 4k) TaxID=543526 RepID=D2RUB3_HALTV|nr:AAA family ATPase [Haloterrigena turkmenica]ADB59182.1 ATPase involved in chromosome partitioning-like protein [Haloterrigena turkmenica DSM 5511]